ncbi:hypothetical protein [Desulfofundulus sp.]|uniref:hypothetical protein n=1 Tax=Desulfofundulus sp. TaxID=2282750 RepID=UPI003C758A5F
MGVKNVSGRESIWDRLRRAEKGEVAFSGRATVRAGKGFSSRFFIKAVCADRQRLLEWARKVGLPGERVFVPDAATPSVTLTGKTAREVLVWWRRWSTSRTIIQRCFPGG